MIAIGNPTNPEVGERFLGTVVKLATFGAFVSLMPGKDELLHVTEVRKLAGGKRVENVDDVLSVGQKIMVEITKIDDRGKLSLAPVLEAPTQRTPTRRSPRPTARRLLPRVNSSSSRPSFRMPSPRRWGRHPSFWGPCQ